MGNTFFSYLLSNKIQGQTKKQKDQANYLKAAIGCDEKTALELLRQSNWDVDRACELHFSSVKGHEKAKPQGNKKQEDLFDNYKGLLH